MPFPGLMRDTPTPAPATDHVVADDCDLLRGEEVLASPKAIVTGARARPVTTGRIFGIKVFEAIGPRPRSPKTPIQASRRLSPGG
jgi:hypothetical protein